MFGLKIFLNSQTLLFSFDHPRTNSSALCWRKNNFSIGTGCWRTWYVERKRDALHSSSENFRLHKASKLQQKHKWERHRFDSNANSNDVHAWGSTSLFAFQVQKCIDDQYNCAGTWLVGEVSFWFLIEEHHWRCILRGSTEFAGPQSNVLKHVTLLIATNGNCTSNQICSFSKGKDTCQSDSG